MPQPSRESFASSRFAHRVVTATLALVAVAATGCRSGGDLIANPHQIIPAADFVAASMPVVPAVPRELAKVPLPEVYVQPGDSLLLEPTSSANVAIVSTDQTVAADGTIDLGVYGRVGVAGATVEEIEDRVRIAVCRLTPEVCEPPEDLPEDPAEAARLIERIARGPVSVRLLSPDSVVFYVLGEVAAPGAYALDGRETVLDALLEAGGLSDRANRCEIILARPTGPHECRVVHRVCYDRLVQLGDASTNYQVRPGDRVYVASKTFCESVQQVCCFWKRGCEHCCDTGSCPCPTPETPTRRPFLTPELTPASYGMPVLPESLGSDLAAAEPLPPAGGEDGESSDDAAKDDRSEKATPLDLAKPSDVPPPSIPLPQNKPSVDLPTL